MGRAVIGVRRRPRVATRPYELNIFSSHGWHASLPAPIKMNVIATPVRYPEPRLLLLRQAIHAISISNGR